MSDKIFEQIQTVIKHYRSAAVAIAATSAVLALIIAGIVSSFVS